MKTKVFVLLLIAALTACNDTSNTKNANNELVIDAAKNNEAPAQPVNISYQIVNTYPHDVKCFTEGLQYVKGLFLESGGMEGESNIRYTELATGKVIKQTNMAKQSFGEGCTVLNGKVYQMTYTENTCYVYDSATLKKTAQFSYNFGEGWGMTTNGKELIVSNGGSNLFFINPDNFKEIKRVGVTNEYGPVGNINELELIKGHVYANIFQTDNIIKIDTSSGRVVGVINLSDLRGKIGITESTNNNAARADVLNGIAYDNVGNRVFITGKYWPKVIQVKFDN